MNLRLSKMFIGMAILVQVLLAGSIDQAYELHLNGSFTESYKEYSSVYTNSNDRLALYGMINSLVMLKRYDEALILCGTVQDSVVVAKETWILGLTNNSAKARFVLDKANKMTGESKAMILRSGGDGFYGAGNYVEAIRWYEDAQKINRDTLTQLAINSAILSKKTKVIQTVSLMGGPIIYSKNGISEQGNRYRYAGGSFLSAGSRWDIKKKMSVEVEYNRFDASFGKTNYGISYESQLYKSLDSSANMPWKMLYNAKDSVARWIAKNPETNRYMIVDSLKTYTKFNNVDSTFVDTTFRDTIWNLYSESYISDSETKVFNDTFSITPDKIFQNGIYAGFSMANVLDRPLTLASSVNLSQSNMTNMNRAASFRIYGGFTEKKLTMGAHWYGTFTEKVGTIQASPEIGGTLKSFSWKVTPSYVLKLKAPEKMNIPKNQISAETELGFARNHFILSTTGSVGKRAFTAESSGKNVVTISLPHRFSGSFYGAVMPGSGRFSIFTLLRYENYEQLSRLIALGGTTFTF